MGEYTTQLKLYKTADVEVVDVEQQLNYNWDICDRDLKRLLEYEYVTVPSPDVVDAVSRSKFYKEYSNSYMTYFKTGNFFYQDPYAFVSPWVSGASMLQAGWFDDPDFPFFYRIIKKAGGTTTQIEWTGAIWTGGPEIDVNTNMTFIDVGDIPVAIRPTVTKYFNVNCGNTAANYKIARIFIGSNGEGQVKLYGQMTTTGTIENRVDFGGIKYNLEVAA